MSDTNSRQSNDAEREATNAAVEIDGGEPESGEPRREAKRTDGGEASDASRASSEVRSDGGVATGREQTDYLDAEVNIFRPSTPFMRDHLRLIWTMFAAWAVFVFGPVIATYLATDFMTSTTVGGFPLHYLLTAMGAPLGALVLSFVYARKRDRLDEKYGIDHSTERADTEAAATATDGGEPGPGEPRREAKRTDGGEASDASRSSSERSSDGGEQR